MFDILVDNFLLPKMLEAEVERQRKDSIRSLEGLTQMLDSIRERGDRLSMSATQWEAQSNKLRVDLENESRLRREVVLFVFIFFNVSLFMLFFHAQFVWIEVGYI